MNSSTGQSSFQVSTEFINYTRLNTSTRVKIHRKEKVHEWHSLTLGFRTITIMTCYGQVSWITVKLSPTEQLEGHNSSRLIKKCMSTYIHTYFMQPTYRKADYFTKHGQA